MSQEVRNEVKPGQQIFMCGDFNKPRVQITGFQYWVHQYANTFRKAITLEISSQVQPRTNNYSISCQILLPQAQMYQVVYYNKKNFINLKKINCSKTHIFSLNDIATCKIIKISRNYLIFSTKENGIQSLVAISLQETKANIHLRIKAYDDSQSTEERRKSILLLC
ncbi:unnamed protein product [Paramecium octaurelia]|uniref:Uncharacterized protein n=1 Tax=Paramecium octaurelia TaxID=43137 RepID=A0A8S1YA31_PAROT|nr:unnamed protein product [Paramecium octaurelia]